MDTVCFEYDNYGKKEYQWTPAECEVFIDNWDGSKTGKAADVPIGIKAWNNFGSYLGVCVEYIKNDPDADTFAMSSREMIQEIRKLRDTIEHAGIGEKVRNK